MSKHRIRDLQITHSATLHHQAQIHYVLFHFLRNAGWTWLWECDSYAGDAPNRVPDGNQELVGAGSWTPLLGASLLKVTTPIHSGTQALSVDSGAVNAGVESSIFTSMENLTTYHVAIWALNNTGQPWNVDIDIGTGYVNVGTIPSDGVYGLYHFNFTSAAAGNRKLRVVDNLNSQGTVYLSDILVIKSYWDYNPLDTVPKGTDGATIAPNQFSSVGYSFVPGDIGKVICIWDTVNPKNSGAYKITATGGGVATVDMRSGTAAFVARSGVTWRMIDLTKAPANQANAGHRSAGFGLQSPHSSGWRLFVRQNIWNAYNQAPSAVWGAPDDTDFDFSTGNFYKTGPSTQRNKQNPYAAWGAGTNPYPNQHYWSFSTITNATNRYWLMTDDTGSFVAQVMWDSASGTLIHDCPVVGHLGSSPYLPGEEAWGLFASWSVWATGNRMNWTGGTSQFAYNGTMIGPTGVAEDAVWGQLGIGAAAVDVVTLSNAGDNPWSANEWVHKPIIVRDPEGVAGHPAEMTADVGVFQGRQNMTHLSTFDSNSYLHFDNGLVWEWDGEAIVP
jgi:hypothetical protein